MDKHIMQVDGNASCSASSDISDVQTIESFDMFHNSSSSSSEESCSISMFDESILEEENDENQISVILNTAQLLSNPIVPPPPWYDTYQPSTQ